jgi:hypothetical protein
VTRNSDALDRLNHALDVLARGLESGSEEAVLSAEGPLAAALGDLAGTDLDQIARRPDLRAAVMNVRLALERCRVLGESAASIAAAFAQPGYDAHGQHLTSVPRPSTVVTIT